MKRDQVLEFLSSHRQELENQFGVSSLALFGSVARDEAGPESDIDVLVEFRETPGLSEYMSLKFWLEDLGRCSATPRTARSSLRCAERAKKKRTSKFEII